jgi:type I site-specific restriction-modification system R (restriction) subunit
MSRIDDSREGAKTRRDVEELAAIVVDTALQLHRDLGPGLLESVYEAVLARMLEKKGLSVERQKAVPVQYQDIEINVDYILMLVERYLKAKGSGQDKEIRANIERAINASPSLRNKKDLIEQFVDSVSTKAKVDAQWQAFVAKKQTVLDKLAAFFERYFGLA